MAQLTINYTAERDIMSSPSQWLRNNVFSYTYDSNTQEGTLTLNDGVTEIGKNAFSSQYLLTLTIPEGIIILNQMIDINIHKLTTVNIPSTVTKIYPSSCDSLLYIRVDNRNSVYNDNNGNNVVIETASNKVVWGAKKAVIPEGVTSIGYSAFSGLRVPYLVLPSTLTTIESLAFWNNKNLVLNILSSTPPTITNNSFNLTLTILVPDQSYIALYENSQWSNYYSDIDVFRGNAIITYTADSDLSTFSQGIINNLITSTYDSTTQIGTLEFPPRFNIPQLAFSNCTDIRKVTFSNEFGSIISFNAFYCCSNLIEINFNSRLTTIEPNAFNGCTSLTSFTIPASVTSLSRNSFEGTGWWNNQQDGILYKDGWCLGYKTTKPTDILIINNCEKIACEAFQNCTGLTFVTLPDSVTTIQNRAFQNCTALTSVTLSNSLTTIGDYAFNGCTTLTSVTLPDSLITIEQYAFSSCTGLTSVTLSESLTTIGQSAFSGCTSLTTIYWNAINITSLGNNWRHNSPIDTIIFGDSVTTIPYSAFSGCTNLTSVTFPNDLITIGDYAFQGCTSLTEIILPDSVTSINNWAFRDCTNLLSVTSLATTPPTLGTNNFTASGDTLYVPDVSLSAYQSANNWSTAFTYYVGITPLVINYKCTTDIMASPSTWLSQNVIAHTWDSTTQEGTLTLDYGVDYIGDNAFNGLGNPLYNNLLSLTIPEGIKSLGNNCIYNCINITSISLPQFLLTCGDYSICGCTNLTDISVPSSITSIGTNFLRGCSHLQSVSFNNNLISYGDQLCYQCSALTTVYWNTNATQSGGSYGPFTLCNNITTVVIGDDVIDCPTIFKQRASITSLTLGNSLTSISDTAFLSCTGLTSVTFPNSLTSIGNRSFQGCTGLSSVTFPNSLTSIGSQAFLSCTGLTLVTLGDSLTSIGGQAFQDCQNLLSVICLRTTPPTLGTNNFTASGDTLYVPSAAKSTYQNTTSWRDAFTTIASLYEVTSTITGSGSVSPSSATVNEGESVTLTITPDEGYGIFSVIDNGTSVPVTRTGMTYTISNIAADHAIAVVFKPLFTITTSAGEGGSITPSMTVMQNEDATIVITPNAGYSVSHVYVDGVDQGSILNYSFQNVVANHTVTAEFVALYTVSTTTTEGGSISPSSSTVVAGSDVTLTITPDEGMLIFNVLDNDTPVPVLNPLGMTYTISNIQENHTVEAIFMVAQTWGFNLEEMIDTDFMIQTLEELEERK